MLLCNTVSLIADLLCTTEFKTQFSVVSRFGTSLNKFTVMRDNVNALTSTLVVRVAEVMGLCLVIFSNNRFID